MLLATIRLGAGATTVTAADTAQGASLAPDIAGIDVRAVRIADAGGTADTEHTVVQVLLDDDRAGFDPASYDAPLVVEVVGPGDELLARELADHDVFRRALLDERERGEPVRRGVLLLTAGELPERWVRLAFLPVASSELVGATLRVHRTTVAELTEGIEVAAAAGAVTDAERSTALTAIEHLHPGAP